MFEFCSNNYHHNDKVAIDFHWGSFFDIADPCSIKDSGHIDNLHCVLWLQLANKFFFLDHGGASHCKI